MSTVTHSLVAAMLALGGMLSGADYYVSEAGNDTNPGTGQAANLAWRSIAKVNTVDLAPGDRVFFEAGKSFVGPLTLGAEDSGANGNVITIASYGTGQATINGGTGNGISLSNCSYVKVTQLTVIGNGRKTGNDRGVGVLPIGAQHVEIDHIDVSGFQRAGVEFRGCTDLRLTYVTAHQNGYAGISSGPESAGISRDVYIGYCKTLDNPGDPTVTNNHSGSGIVLYKVDGGLVEYCESAQNGYDMPWDQNGPVGIWFAYVKNITVQYCISHNNQSPAYDGGGFDFDGDSHDCLIQYCYAYENKHYGYQFAVFNSSLPNSNLTLRYCISANNSDEEMDIYIPTSQTNVNIYNNIFYNKSGGQILNGRGATSEFRFRNNIFLKENTDNFLSGFNNSVIMQGNCYWDLNGGTNSWNGTASTLAEWRASGHETLNGQNVGTYANPLLTDIANYPKLTDPTQLVSLNAFRLLSGSPCIDAGIDLNGQFGTSIGTRDFYGASLPQGSGYDIGHHEINQGPAAPIIISVAPTSAFVGVPFSYTLQASGSPVATFTATGLPSWLSLSGSVISGTPTATGTSGSITVTATNSQGSSQQSFTVTVTDVDPTLAGHWKLDEISGTAAADASTQGNAGALTGNATWLPTGGMRNGALDFSGNDGSDDFVTLPNVTALQNVQTNSYSLAAWVRADSTPAGTGSANNASYGIVLKAGMHLGLSYRADQKYEINHWLSNGNVVSVISAVTYAPGTFHQVTGVVDRAVGLMTLYVDGVSAGTANFAANSAVNDYGTTPWRIGIAQPGAGTYRWAMDGAIDDVRIYNRTLSAGEVAALANNNASVAPTISSQPGNQTVTAGQSATFTVTAAGTSPFTYVWKRGTTVVGGNSATLSLANVQSADAGSYTCTVTNAVSSVTSNAATLTVNPAPTAPLAPSSLTSVANSSSQITLTWTDSSNNETGFKIERKTASGSFSQVALVGAGVVTYVNSGLTASTAYAYRVRASNATGDSAYSSESTATTSASTATPPTVATPANGPSTPVTGTTFNVSVLGGPAGTESGLTYAWTVVSGPAGGTATFSSTGSNASKNAVATVTQAGVWSIQVVITRTSDGTTTVSGPFSVTVVQTTTSIALTGAATQVASGGTVQFTATARDQFTTAMATQPTLTWIATGGTVSATGLYTAGLAAGMYQLTASGGGQSANVPVEITATPGGGTGTPAPEVSSDGGGGGGCGTGSGLAALLLALTWGLRLAVSRQR